MELSTSGFQNYFLKEKKPFTKKRDVNWLKVKIISLSLVVLIILGVLLYPTGESQSADFGGQTNARVPSVNQSDSPDETIRQMQEAKVVESQVHSSLDYLYEREAPKGGSSGAAPNRNSSMIITRGGIDSRNQIPPGTALKVSLLSGVTVEEENVPVLGILTSDVNADSGVAIPQGAKLRGDASFDRDSEKLKINWSSVIYPDGRERPISATGSAYGNVHTKQFRNAVGQTLTKFVGAYAAGSMNSGPFGANAGGHRNGIRNAIAETASERASNMGEDMQKEKKWVELEKGERISSVISQPFSFREPGGVIE